ncbi:hypothetical protein CANTEDRAFT_127833 [Yamadazyma tenuis ATCC 10573]|nr:uncharacterized protein CANTEDRAFT_127833 [Yamadazyma tenuis ATCC 10573]EGV60517.1 hypothetical protein CANTEDRAFT_127833 [Yamadazyma tenuis ATCC 10573]
MASWVPVFMNHINVQLEHQAEPFLTFQLSTIGIDGFPQNRTVVYRGFLFDEVSTNIITFTTDKRMPKYSELAKDDRFEAVFYLPGARKQFRFKGHARVIDADHHPIVKLDNYKPRDVGDIDSDDEDEAKESSVPEPSPNAFAPSPTTSIPKSEDTSFWNHPIEFHLVSPKLINQLHKDHNASYSNFNDIHVPHELTLKPPTDEEYAQELSRQWDTLSKALKKSFRKPDPGSRMTPEKSKLIDSIKRGVDGKKDIDGYKNFAVVAMFIDTVDFYDSESDRRVRFEKDKFDMWSEYEICP